jgi:hypothetical protein
MKLMEQNMVKNSSCDILYHKVSCCNLVIFPRTYSGIFYTCIQVINCLEARGMGAVLFDINFLAGASFYSVFCLLWWEHGLQKKKKKQESIISGNKYKM